MAGQGKRLTEAEKAKRAAESAANSRVREFLNRSPNLKQTISPRAKNPFIIRKKEDKELVQGIKDDAAQGNLSQEALGNNLISLLVSGKATPELLRNLNLPEDMESEEFKEIRSEIIRARDEGGLRGVDKIMQNLQAGTYKPGESYAPKTDTLAKTDWDTLENTPAIYRVEGAMEGISPNQPPAAIDPKTGQPVQNPVRSLIPPTLEKYLSRQRISGGQPIANATVNPVKPLKDDQGNLVPGRREVTDFGAPSTNSGLLNVRTVAVEEPEVGDSSSSWSPSGENKVAVGGAPLDAFARDYGQTKKPEEPTTLSLNSLYLFRTKEALKSYIQLKNIDTNKYVVVPIPNHLRENRYLKSFNFNISNPSFRYMLVHKSFIDFKGDATPVLKVKDLVINENSKKYNDPDIKAQNPEFVKKYGTMKSVGSNELISLAPTENSNNLIELSTTKSKNSNKEDSKKNDKVGKVMHEFKEGKLHSGKNGPKVTDKDQAMAIALSEAGKSKKKTSEKGNIVEKLAESTFNPVAQDLAESGNEGVNTIIELTAKTKSKESLSDACWEGYEAVGFKKKNGKKVPNCVPKKKK